jgi:hypothetical protein
MASKTANYSHLGDNAIWDRDELPRGGLCTHSPLLERVDGLEFEAEQLRAVAEQRRLHGLCIIMLGLKLTMRSREPTRHRHQSSLQSEPRSMLPGTRAGRGSEMKLWPTSCTSVNYATIRTPARKSWTTTSRHDCIFAEKLAVPRISVVHLVGRAARPSTTRGLDAESGRVSDACLEMIVVFRQIVRLQDTCRRKPCLVKMCR